MATHHTRQLFISRSRHCDRIYAPRPRSKSSPITPSQQRRRSRRRRLSPDAKTSRGITPTLTVSEDSRRRQTTNKSQVPKVDQKIKMMTKFLSVAILVMAVSQQLEAAPSTSEQSEEIVESISFLAVGRMPIKTCCTFSPPFPRLRDSQPASSTW